MLVYFGTDVHILCCILYTSWLLIQSLSPLLARPVFQLFILQEVLINITTIKEFIR